MNLWQKVTKDLQRELKAGIAFIKGSTAAMKKKGKEISQEEKRRYNLIELKTQIHEQIAGLGGRVYDLSSKDKDPMEDKRVKGFLNRIKKLEMQVTKIEKKPEVSKKKVLKKRITKKVKTTHG